jgi:Exportin 1-like protein
MIQICICLAALGLQLRSWTSVVADVEAIWKQTGSLDALLQFLAVLPEEAYDGKRTMLSVISQTQNIAHVRKPSSTTE